MKEKFQYKIENKKVAIQFYGKLQQLQERLQLNCPIKCCFFFSLQQKATYFLHPFVLKYFYFEVLTFYRVCHGFRLMKRDNYFWSILTVFELSIIFGGSYGNIENWLDPKIEPPL